MYSPLESPREARAPAARFPFPGGNRFAAGGARDSREDSRGVFQVDIPGSLPGGVDSRDATGARALIPGSAGGGLVNLPIPSIDFAPWSREFRATFPGTHPSGVGRMGSLL